MGLPAVIPEGGLANRNAPLARLLFFVRPLRQTGFATLPDKKNALPSEAHFGCREEGIRTLDTLLEYTHFPGVRLRPLGHLSKGCKELKNFAG